jgi:hypothetical protein
MSDYAKGFKDGFLAGVEEGKKLAPKQTRLDDYVFGQRDTCPKCGIKIGGAMGYVCSSVNCPTYYQTYSYGAVGANGPVGTSEPPDNNSVWVNGSWVSLGN